MKKNQLIAVVIIGVAVLFAGFIVWNSYQAEGNLPGADLSSFVQCIKGKGIVFYGAFWCPHCQATKKEFGASASQLPYVECSTPDGQSQTQVCVEKGITEYPTWVLPDGTRITGEHTLQELSQDFGCPLPSGDASSTPVTTAAASSATSTR
ncbi:MAG: hypothetical protein KGI73_03765 [Patescibacteria group bacterium]|nr:hypothetical protein [Patescibacteria group bacterium]